MKVERHGVMRVALVAPTAADYRDVMIRGESGILAVSRPDFMPIFEPSNRRLIWPNGAQALCFSAEEPDRLRGPQHAAAWLDELASFAKGGQECWDMLQLGMRLGANPQTFISTTPKPSKLLRWLMKSDDTIVSRGTTYDNRANLPASYFDKIIKSYEGTRLGRQELNAELLEDLPGALWTVDLIDAFRLTRPEELPHMKRIIVGVDPSGTDKETGSRQGIVVCGLGETGLFYVIDDLSCSLSPQGWAARAVNAYLRYGADMIVAERNFGGDMVRSVIQSCARNVPIRMVTASRGKHLRAEPIAALYERGMVRHLGYFKELEEQLTQFTTEGYQGGGSPDAADAMVHAMTELALPKTRIGIARATY